MADAPVIDVVIPAYKSEAWLAGAVRSALAVDAVRAVVVIDDGSPTPQEAAARAGDDGSGRLAVERQDNTGPAGARNRGIERCLTHDPIPDWVVFLDADDELAPGVVDAARDGTGHRAAAVAPSRIEFYDDGREKPKSPPAWALPGRAVEPGLVHKPHGLWTGSGLMAAGWALNDGARFADDLIVVEDLDFYRRLGRLGTIVTSEHVALRRRLFDDGANLTSDSNLTRWAVNLAALCARWHEPAHDEAWRECMTWMLNRLVKRRVGGEARAEVLEAFGRHGWAVPMKIRLRALTMPAR